MNAEILGYQKHLLGSAISRFTLLARESVLSIPVDAFAPGFLRQVRISLEYLTSHETPVTPNTVHQNLVAAGAVDPTDHLRCLVDMAVSDANVVSFAKKVRDWHYCHEAVHIMHTAMREIEGISDGTEALELLIKRIKKIRTSDSRSSGPVRLGDTTRRVLEDTKRRRDTGVVEGYQTGVKGIDTAFGRMMAGDLIIVAARPGMGKTELALTITKSLCKNTGIVSYIANLEMTDIQIGERVLSSESGLSVDTLDDVDLLRNDIIMQKIESAANEIDALPIYTQDLCGVTPAQLCERVERFAEQVGNLGLVVIDHLGLFTFETANRAQAVGDATQLFKNLAKRLGIPIILLSQLNRGVEQRENKRPTLSDLRESGAIEQDADKIVFIYRDGYYHDNSPWGSVSELINGKRRRGEAESSFIDFVSGHFVDVPDTFSPPVEKDGRSSRKPRFLDLPDSLLEKMGRHEY